MSQEFGQGMRSALESSGPAYHLLRQNFYAVTDFTWDLHFQFDPFANDASAVDQLGVTLQRWLSLSLASKQLTLVDEQIGRAAAQKERAIARDKISGEVLNAIAQNKLGIPDCYVVCNVVASEEQWAVSPFRVSVSVGNIVGKKFTEAQYLEFQVGLQEYFLSVLGLKLGINTLFSGLQGKKEEKRGRDKGKISGNWIHLVFEA